MTWRERAECRDADPEIFFNGTQGRGYTSKATTRRALAYCDRCTVWAQCLDFAISTSRNDDHGIWGGMTSTQRIRLRQRTKLAALQDDARETPTAPVGLVTALRSG